MNLSPSPSCPACGAANPRELWSRHFRGRDWALVRCGRCALHFTSPTPTDDDLRRFYEGDYHAPLRDGDGTDRAFGAKYRRYATLLRSHLERGRVVDIGCSTGLLVRTLRDHGYDAMGIELNASSAAWGRERYGITIHTEPIERCGFAPGSLDAILLTDVLEHMRHPGDFLASAARFLRIGGTALVTFPDIASLESRYRRALSILTGRPWMWSSCHAPLHVWEFTRATAERTFDAAGFRVVGFGRSQLPCERHASVALRALEAPVRLLSLPPIAHRLGSQMEFLLERVRDVGVPEGEAQSPKTAQQTAQQAAQPAIQVAA